MQDDYTIKAKKALIYWLESQNYSVYRFSKLIGLSYPNCHNWIRKGTIPSLDVAIRIEEFTDGFVSCMSWKKDPSTEKKVEKKNANTTNKSKSHDTDKHSKTSSKGKR